MAIACHCRNINDAFLKEQAKKIAETTDGPLDHKQLSTACGQEKRKLGELSDLTLTGYTCGCCKPVFKEMAASINAQKSAPDHESHAEYSGKKSDKNFISTQKSKNRHPQPVLT